MPNPYAPPQPGDRTKNPPGGAGSTGAAGQSAGAADVRGQAGGGGQAGDGARDGAGLSGQGGPSGPRPGLARPTPMPVDPTTRRRVAGQAATFGVFMLLTLAFMSLRFPWQLAGVVPALCALVMGVRTMWTLWRARLRGFLPVAVVAGIAIIGVSVMQLVTTALLWDISSDYQACRDGALTSSAASRCDVQRQQSLEDWLNKLTQYRNTTVPTGTSS